MFAPRGGAARMDVSAAADADSSWNGWKADNARAVYGTAKKLSGRKRK